MFYVWMPIFFIYSNLVAINGFSVDVSDRIRSGNATSSGVKLQFKSPMGRNSSSEHPFKKNVSHLAKD